ncbi:hypothetical protein H2199_005824 [Coniosporium tulheliwenetii]|uniref:Uncharacterized protein n=1 Tax=Coniosporium tulheliwenetii TaxID=3383036 RepID=A0ACC2YYE6_9PEZI|nr:hypothetical protein H2199_005824 [Cladosporium sp. JES 115]
MADPNQPEPEDTAIYSGYESPVAYQEEETVEYEDGDRETLVGQEDDVGDGRTGQTDEGGQDGRGELGDDPMPDADVSEQTDQLLGSQPSAPARRPRAGPRRRQDTAAKYRGRCLTCLGHGHDWRKCFNYCAHRQKAGFPQVRHPGGQCQRAERLYRKHGGLLPREDFERRLREQAAERERKVYEEGLRAGRQLGQFEDLNRRTPSCSPSQSPPRQAEQQSFEQPGYQQTDYEQWNRRARPHNPPPEPQEYEQPVAEQWTRRARAPPQPEQQAYVPPRALPLRPRTRPLPRQEYEEDYEQELNPPLADATLLLDSNRSRTTTSRNTNSRAMSIGNAALRPKTLHLEREGPEPRYEEPAYDPRYEEPAYEPPWGALPRRQAPLPSERPRPYREPPAAPYQRAYPPSPRPSPAASSFAASSSTALRG